MPWRDLNQEERLTEPRARMRLPVIVLTMILVLGFSVVLFVLVLRLWLGPFKMMEFLSGRVGPQKIRVAILDSAHTSTELKKVGGDYPRLMSQWRGLLNELVKAEKITFRPVSDLELEKGLSGFEVLILPSSLALSDSQINSLRSFTTSGGGLLISWAAGTRQPNGDWRGWQFLNEMAGLEIVSDFPLEKEPSLVAVIRGDSPLAVGISPGQRLSILPRSQPLVALSGTFDASWARPTATLFEGRTQLAGVEPITLAGGRYGTSIAHHVLGKGRVVWLGFGLDSLGEAYLDKETFKQLFTNAFSWLASQPVALVKTWPQDYQAAAIFALDSEENFKEMALALEVFRKAGARGSFYLLSDLAKENPELVTRAKALGEVALHGDTHASFKGQPPEVQTERLSRAKTDLFRLTGREIIGFRAPGLEMDDNTLKALARLKAQYYFSSRVTSSVPRVFLYPELVAGKVTVLTGQQKMVELPQPFHDDYGLFFKAGSTASQALAVWNAELRRALTEGGLFVLSYHTTPPWGLLSGKANILAELVDNALTANLWVATATEVVQWWLMREGLALKAEAISGGKSSLTLTNNNNALVKEARLLFFAPESYQTVNVTVPDQFKDRIAYLFIPQEKKLVATFKDMQPGETRWLFVEKGS